jgi:hypothetical protein
VDESITEAKLKDECVTSEKLAKNIFSREKVARIESFDKVGILNGETWQFNLSREDINGSRNIQLFKSQGGGAGINFDVEGNFDREELSNGLTLVFVRESIIQAASPSNWGIYRGYFTNGGSPVFINGSSGINTAPKIKPGCQIIISSGSKKGYIKSVEEDNQYFSVYFMEDLSGSCTVYGVLIDESLDIGSLGAAIIGELSTYDIPKIDDPKSKLNPPAQIMDATKFFATKSDANRTLNYAFEWENPDANGTAVKKSWMGKFYKKEVLTGTDKQKRYNRNKLTVEYPDAMVLKRIKYCNFHDNGRNTDVGIKKFDLYGSNTSIFLKDDGGSTQMLTEPDPYNLDGWTKIDADIQLDIYDGSSDPYREIDIDNNESFRYYCMIVTENYGDANKQGIRNLQFQGNDVTAATGYTYNMSNKPSAAYDSSDIGTLNSCVVKCDTQGQTLKFMFCFSGTAGVENSWRYYDKSQSKFVEIVEYSGSEWKYRDSGGVMTSASPNAKYAAMSKAFEIHGGNTLEDVESFTRAEWEGTYGWTVDMVRISVAVSFYSFDEKKFPNISSISFNSEEWEMIEDVDTDTGKPVFSKGYSGLLSNWVKCGKTGWDDIKLRAVVVSA